MNWIPITAESKKHIRVGDFISATYGIGTERIFISLTDISRPVKGIIYKILKIHDANGEMFLDVGVCDKYGNIEREDWVYSYQSITYFDCYLPRDRKARVV